MLFVLLGPRTLLATWWAGVARLIEAEGDAKGLLVEGGLPCVFDRPLLLNARCTELDKGAGAVEAGVWGMLSGPICLRGSSKLSIGTGVRC